MGCGEECVMDPELRRDPVVATRISIISRARAKRPLRPDRATCPFCPGNEHATPPATLVVVEEGGRLAYEREERDERVRGWKIRIFPNKYPALTPLSPECYGYHEVLVETPDHHRHPPDMELEEIALVFQAALRRLRAIAEDEKIEQLLLFRNHGSLGGTSISHPHSQIVAFPFVPPCLREELHYFEQEYERGGECPYCALLERELESPRLVYENGHFAVLAAYAPRAPFELLIAPLDHQRSLLEMDAKDVYHFSDAYKAALSALKEALGDPPYNLWFHTAPLRERVECYHWHVEVVPAVSIWAGVEKGAGVYLIGTPPEEAAEILRRRVAESRLSG